MSLPNPFPAQRWRLRWRVQRPIDWPDFEGSTLRGLYGHALRRLACSTGQPDCTGCPLQPRCAYTALFEPPAQPHAPGGRTDPAPPFVLQPDPQGPRHLRAGEVYACDWVLIGSARQRTELAWAAWQQALHSEVGGHPGGAAQWLGAEPEGPASLALPVPEDGADALPVQLLTPVRIKRGGQVRGADQLTAADWLWALVRRVADVCEWQLGQPPGLDFAALKQAAQAVRWQDAQLHWQAGRRWSNRQRQYTPLDGVVGCFTLCGDLRPFWPLLHLGQWLNVGGKTSVGLGRYVIKD